MNKTSLGQNLRDVCVERDAKINETKVNYFGVLKYLFPEIAGLPSLNILVMDAIFYNPNGSMCYICSDGKRGLIKTKCKNYSQIFLKRKAELDSTIYFSKNNVRDSDVSELETYTGFFSFQKHLNYVALLRYKDQSFIRLKEA